MAEVPESEGTGSNRRVWIVVGIVALIIIYLVAKSVIKKRTIAGLASPDNTVRTNSTKWLMEAKIFTDTLSRQPVRIKRPMIRTLRAMNTAESATELVNLMKDRNPTVQNEAQFALEAMVPVSLPVLVTALENADLNTKNRAVAALIRIGAPALAPVKDAEQKDTYPLIDAVADAEQRAGAIQVISGLVNRLRDPAIKQRVVDGLLAKLNDAKADAATKAAAVEIFGRIDAQQAAAAVRKTLTDRKVDPALRKASLVALGRLRHPDAYELLSQALSETDVAVKTNAIRGLGELRDPRAVGLLRTYLFGYNEALRDAAVAALTNIGAPAVPALAQLVRSDRVEVRLGSVRALEGIKDPRVPGVLALALKDHDEIVRQAAAGALARPGDTRAVAPLLQALNDPAWRVASQARDSLAIVGAPAIPGLVAALSKESQSQAAYYAQGALEKIGAPAVPALIAVAKASRPPASNRAVLALGAIGDTRALPVLRSLLAAADPGLRNTAGRAFKQVSEGRRTG